MGRRSPWHEPDPWRVARRGLTISLVTVLALAAVALAPILLPLAALIDALGRRPWSLTRTLVFFTFFSWAEVAGVAAAGLLWLRYFGRWEARRSDYLAANERLQRRWATVLFDAGARIFGFSTQVEGGSALAAPGKLVVLMRHASTVDTLIPVVLLAPFGRSFRYVLKRELAMDPCLDIVGHRLPNCFVRRGGGNSAAEVQRVLDLAADMTPHEALAIFPEGTRFSSAKRAALIARFREAGNDDLAAFAEGLQATLSPLRGGVLGLLEHAKDADVVVIAHAGLEGAASFKTFVRGGLIGARIRVRVRRIRASEVPREPAALGPFVMNLWRDVDSYVTAARAPR